MLYIFTIYLIVGILVGMSIRFLYNYWIRPNLENSQISYYDDIFYSTTYVFYSIIFWWWVVIYVSCYTVYALLKKRG